MEIKLIRPITTHATRAGVALRVRLYWRRLQAEVADRRRDLGGLDLTSPLASSNLGVEGPLGVGSRRLPTRL